MLHCVSLRKSPVNRVLFFLLALLFFTFLTPCLYAAPVLCTGYSWQTVLERDDRTLTYSFDTTGGYAVEGYLSESLDEVFAAIPQWRDVIRRSLNSWGSAADISFVEVPDSGDAFGAFGAQGALRFTAHPLYNALAHAQVPPPTGTVEETIGSSGWGDVHYNPHNPDAGGWDASFLQNTTTHELGHALGIVAHNLDPGSALFWLGGVAEPSEHDLADIRALYFAQNEPAPILTDPLIDRPRDWVALADGSPDARATLTLTKDGSVLTSGEQKTGIKGVGASLADENYGFDYVDLVLEAGGRIATDGHNAYGIGAGDFNAITVDGFINTEGYSADGVALMGRSNSLRTGIASLIRTAGAGANGIFVGGEEDAAANHYGNTVLAAGRIETSGAGGCGIYAAGFSSVALSGSILTLGSHAAGIGSDQYGSQHIAVEETAAIETRGRDAYGVLIRGANNVVAMQGAITTAGEKSYGIYGFWSDASDIATDGTIRTAGREAMGVRVNGSDVRITVNGSVVTAGEKAHGIYAFGSNNSLTLNGTVNTTGEEARGLSTYSGAYNQLLNRGTLATAGTRGYGVYAYGAHNVLANSGSIFTHGSSAHALLASGSYNRLANQGSIATTGEKAHALFASGSGNRLANDGRIATAGDLSYGLFVAGGGNLAANRGDILTDGALSHGMVATGGGHMLVHAGRIETAGAQAFGLFVREGGNVVEIAGDTVSRQAEAMRLGSYWNSEADSVEQSMATGNLLLLHGTPRIGGDIVNDGADNGASAYFGIALDEDSPTGYAVAATDLVYDGNFGGRLWQGQVLSGRARLNGTLSAFSNLVVHPGAILGGTTTLTGDLVNSGYVAPGNSIGTLTVAGDYLQAAGATLQMEIGGSSSDQLLVGGEATFLDGSLLRIAPIAPVLSGDLVLLSAAGSLSGMPQLTLADSAVLDFSLLSGGQTLILQVDRTAYADLAAGDNQQQLAAALDRLATGATGDLASVLLQIDALEQAATVRQAFAGLSPTAYAALPDATFAAMRGLVDALPTPGGSSLKADDGWIAHARLLSKQVDRGAGDGVAGYRYDNRGFAAGADRTFDGYVLGAALSYQKLQIEHDNSHSRSESDGLFAVLRGIMQRDGWYLRGALGYGHQWDDSRREVRVVDLVRSATSHGEADILFTGLEGGFGFPVGPGRLIPMVGLDYAACFWGGFEEKDAGAMNVKIGSTTTESLRSSFGLAYKVPIAFGARFRLDTRLRLVWSHELGDGSHAYRAQLAGERLRVRGQSLGRDLLLAGLSLQSQLTDHFFAGVGLDYERRREDDGFTLQGGLTFVF